LEFRTGKLHPVTEQMVGEEGGCLFHHWKAQTQRCNLSFLLKGSCSCVAWTQLHSPRVARGRCHGTRVVFLSCFQSRLGLHRKMRVPPPWKAGALCSLVAPPLSPQRTTGPHYAAVFHAIIWMTKRGSGWMGAISFLGILAGA
jgi:hypothetical protein